MTIYQFRKLSYLICYKLKRETSRPNRTEPHHDKTSKVNVHPAKTQISLGIRPV